MSTLPPKWHRHFLENGITVHLFCLRKHARLVSTTFTFQPGKVKKCLLWQHVHQWEQLGYVYAMLYTAL